MVVSLRAATEEDEDFLYRVFASTREEFTAIGWSPEQIEGFLRMQWAAQRAAFIAAYQDADHSIIIVDGAPAGRLLVSKAGARCMLVDISLLPPFRSRGIGTQLIGDLQKRFDAVLLHVATSNAGARRLYQRLGFTRIAGDAMYDEMRWDRVS